MGAAKDLWMREQAIARKAFDDTGDEAAYRKKLEYLLGGTEDSADQIEDTIAIAKRERKPRFADVGCSSCGMSFGPGDHGFSHCEHHKHLKGYDR